jgi:hypothetical protein
MYVTAAACSILSSKINTMAGEQRKIAICDSDLIYVRIGRGGAEWS